MRAGWLDKDPNARYANPASRRSEIAGWIASLQRVRAWLNAAGRTEQRLLCVGGGRGDTQALGTLELPHTLCCVRTRNDSRWCALPQAGCVHACLKWQTSGPSPTAWERGATRRPFWSAEALASAMGRGFAFPSCVCRR